MTNNKIQVLYPSYYNDFKCKADKCRNTCCQGWKIIIFEKEYKKIKSVKMSNEFRKITNKSMKKLKLAEKKVGYAEIAMNEKAECPMLNCDRLCRLQIECGYQTLPKVCQIFPRNFLYSGNVIYKYLNPSCEVVIHQLLNLYDGVEFIMDDDIDDNILEKEIIYRTIFKDNFFEIYSAMVDILQNRKFTLNERLLYLGLAVKKLSNNFDKEDFDLQIWCDKYSKIPDDFDCNDIINATAKGKSIAILSNLRMLSVLFNEYEDFKDLKSQVNNLLKNINYTSEDMLIFDNKKFSNLKEKYDVYFNEKDYFWENFIITIIPTLIVNYQNINIWDFYRALLIIYSIFKLILIGNCYEDLTNERVEDIIKLFCQFAINGKFTIVILDYLNTTNCLDLAELLYLIY